MTQYVERHHSTVADFEEVVRELEDDHVSPVIKSTLPSAGKTPTITRLEAELAATVDGGKRVLSTDGKPGQGLVSRSQKHDRQVHSERHPRP